MKKLALHAIKSKLNCAFVRFTDGSHLSTPAVAAGAQVHSDHGVICGKLMSITAIKDLAPERKRREPTSLPEHSDVRHRIRSYDLAATGH